jgi:hypothetical protein
MLVDDNRKVDGMRAGRGDGAYLGARRKRKHQRRIAEAADIHGSRVQCLAQRLRGRKVEPLDLVRQILQLARRFENAARLQRLVAYFEHGQVRGARHARP